MDNSAAREADGHGVGIDISSTMAAIGIVGLWDYRLDEGLVYCDKAMATSYGVNPMLASHGLPPVMYRQAIHPDDLPHAISALHSAIETGGEYRVRYRLRDLHDKRRLIEVRGRSSMEDGRTVRVSGFNIDVTHMLDWDDTQDALDALADLAIDALTLARQMQDAGIVRLAEALLANIGRKLAARLSKDTEGTA